jgi:tetratricopeptide (TPR) repeat protein
MPQSALEVSFEDLDLVRERQQHLAAFVAEAKTWSKLQWQTPPCQHAYTTRLRALVDFGFVADACGLSETLLAQMPTAFPGRALVQAYMAHAETARKIKIPKQKELYAALQASTCALERGHGFAGTSLIALLEGDFENARADIGRARYFFQEAGQNLDVWKMDIREIMLLRFANNYTAASEACRRILDLLATCPQREKIDATAVRISLLATLASNALEMGNLAEALRVLKGAARLARALPESQASVYALSQYGNALQKAGRDTEAIAWLQEASSRQRVVEPAAHLNTQSVLLRCFLSAKRWTSALALAQEMLASRMHGVDPELRSEIETLACSLQTSLFLVDAPSRLVCPTSIGTSEESLRARAAFFAVCSLMESAHVKIIAARNSTPTGAAPGRQSRLVWDTGNERLVVHHADGRVAEHDARAGTALVAALQKLVSHAPQEVSLADLFPALPGEHPRSTARRRQRAVKTLVEEIRCAERNGINALALCSGLTVSVLANPFSPHDSDRIHSFPEVTS